MHEKKKTNIPSGKFVIETLTFSSTHCILTSKRPLSFAPSMFARYNSATANITAAKHVHCLHQHPGQCLHNSLQHKGPDLRRKCLYCKINPKCTIRKFSLKIIIFFCDVYKIVNHRRRAEAAYGDSGSKQPLLAQAK